MIARIVRSLLICFIFQVFTAEVAAQQFLVADELIGTYVSGHTFGGTLINLKANGVYFKETSSCTFTTEESGQYVLAAGELRFTILKFIGKQNGDEKEVDLLQPQVRKKFFGLS